MKAEDCKLPGVEVIKLSRMAGSVTDLLIEQENGDLKRPYRIKEVMQAIIDDQFFISSFDEEQLFAFFRQISNLVENKTGVYNVFSESVTASIFPLHFEKAGNRFTVKQKEKIKKITKKIVLDFFKAYFFGSITVNELMTQKYCPCIVVIPEGLSLMSVAHAYGMNLGCFKDKGKKQYFDAVTQERTKAGVALFFPTPFANILSVHDNLLSKNNALEEYSKRTGLKFVNPNVCEALVALQICGLALNIQRPYKIVSSTVLKPNVYAEISLPHWWQVEAIKLSEITQEHGLLRMYKIDL